MPDVYDWKAERVFRRAPACEERVWLPLILAAIVAFALFDLARWWRDR